MLGAAAEPVPVETHAVAACLWCRAKLVKAAASWWCPTEACRTRQREWSVQVQRGMVWEPWFVPLPAQVEFYARRAPRKCWGGSAGPGKSVGSRRGAIRKCFTIPGLNVLLIRKTFPELERTHIKAFRREAQELGFTWSESRRTAEFANGSTIECGHLEDEAAVQKYLSSEYDLIIVDEAVQIVPDALMELMSRARTSNPRVVEAGGAEVWLVTNPGGPSHALLKDLFLSHQPDTERYPALARTYRPEQWAFIGATLDDNPYIDPDYESLALGGLRRARYEQLRHGDWDAADGQFFEGMTARSHARTVSIARPIRDVIEAVDWGFTSPGCVGWFVPVGDNHWHCLAEWKFQRRTAEEVAQGIVAQRRALGIAQVRSTVVDPSMFNKTGHAKGESFAETFARHGVPCRRGDNDRVMGWPRLAAWFRESPDGTPWLTFDKSCVYLLRSIPALLADTHNPEDIDTRLDDHGADMTRYFVMSRPPLWTIEAERSAPPARFSPAWFKALAPRREAGVLA